MNSAECDNPIVTHGERDIPYLDSSFRVRARELRRDQSRGHRRRRRPRADQRPPHRAHRACAAGTATGIAADIRAAIGTATAMSRSLVVTVAQSLQLDQCRVHAHQCRISHFQRRTGLGDGHTRIGQFRSGHQPLAFGGRLVSARGGDERGCLARTHAVHLVEAGGRGG